MGYRLSHGRKSVEVTGDTLQSFLGSWRDDRGRNVIPPGVSLPGSFATVPPKTALATYPDLRRVRAMISVRGRTRTGRLRAMLR